MRHYGIFFGLAAVMLLAAACTTEDPTSTPTSVPAAATPTSMPQEPTSTATPTPTATATAMPTPEAQIAGAAIKAIQHPDLGTILSDASGRTVYVFTHDERNVASCTGNCAQNWPPLLTVGDPTAEEGVVADRLGTVTRDDGSTQVTYNGRSLYYFARDEKPGDANGQNIIGAWFVVSTYGGPIQSNAKVQTADHPDLGTILSDASGRTPVSDASGLAPIGRALYVFTKDERNVSNCTGGCAQNWPPLLTVGDPTAEEGVVADRLGTVTRADGSTQVTYNGRPLYYFANDDKPGDANGQNIIGAWFVVSTYGGPIQSNAKLQTADHLELGTIVSDASGRTLYVFTNDEPNVSNCTGGCPQNWPPLLTVGDPTAEEGVASDILGTITRADGSTQVTYNGRPLYHFAKDEKPGDAKGQNLIDKWFVVSPEGEPIGAPMGGDTGMMDAPQTVEVSIVSFNHMDLEVAVGTTVTWTNQHSASHTTTSGQNGLFVGPGWDSSTLSDGQSFSYTFDQVGTFAYTCRFHGFMNGTVTVTDSTVSAFGSQTSGSGESEY